jgi:hypothetical protein
VSLPQFVRPAVFFYILLMFLSLGDEQQDVESLTDQ